MPDECERHVSHVSGHRGDEVGGRVVLNDDEQALVVDGAVVVARRRRPHGRSLVAIQRVCSEPETDSSTEVDARGESTKYCTPASPPMPPSKVALLMKAAIFTAEWCETPAARAVEHLSLGWYGRATPDKEP